MSDVEQVNELTAAAFTKARDQEPDDALVTLRTLKDDLGALGDFLSPAKAQQRRRNVIDKILDFEMRMNNAQFRALIEELGESLKALEVPIEMARAAAEGMPLRKIAEHFEKISEVVKTVDAAQKDLKAAVKKVKDTGADPTAAEAEALVASVNIAADNLKSLLATD